MGPPLNAHRQEDAKVKRRGERSAIIPGERGLQASLGGLVNGNKSLRADPTSWNFYHIETRRL
jgi:hypothetical protein